MVLLRAVGAFECSSNKEMFCKRHCLRLKALLEIRKLRQQLTNIGVYVCVCALCVDAPSTFPFLFFLVVGFSEHELSKFMCVH